MVITFKSLSDLINQITELFQTISITLILILIATLLGISPKELLELLIKMLAAFS